MSSQLDYVLLGGPDRRLAALVGDLALSGAKVRASTVRALTTDPPHPETVLLLPILSDDESWQSTLTLVRQARSAAAVVVLTENMTARDAVALMRQPGVDIIFLDEGAEALTAAASRLRAAAAERAAPAGPTPTRIPTFPAPGEPRTEAAARAATLLELTANRGNPVPVRTSSPSAAGLVYRLPAFELPPLDPSVHTIQALLDHEATSVVDVENLVSREPGLVAPLLRASNCAYYRTPKLITNLRDAVVRMGVRQSLAVLMEVSVTQTLKPPTPEAQGRLAAAWANATFTARLTRKLAELEGFARPHDAYLAALMHNVGEWVLIWNLYRQPGVVTLARYFAEGPRIAGMHECVGQQVAERWGLPPAVQALVTSHHQPRRGETHRDAQLRLATLGSWALARELFREYLGSASDTPSATWFDQMGLGAETRSRIADEAALAALGLSEPLEARSPGHGPGQVASPRS